MSKSLKKAIGFILVAATILTCLIGIGAVTASKSAFAVETAVVSVEGADNVVSNASEFTLNLRIKNPTGISIFETDFRLTYDSAAFDYVSGSVDTKYFLAGSTLNPKPEDGYIKVAMQSSGISITAADFVFATLRFKPKADIAAKAYTFGLEEVTIATIDDGHEGVPSSVQNKTVTVTAPSTAADLTVAVKNGSNVLAGTMSGTTYTVTNTVPYAVSRVSIVPTPSKGATVKIQNAAVASGASKSVDLKVGVNSFTAEVTAEDGTTKKSYTVRITRAEGDATVAIGGVKISYSDGAELSVNVEGSSYTVTDSVPFDRRESLVLNASVAGKSTLKLNGSVIASAADTPLSLVAGENVLKLTVTAETGATADYTVKINVQAPSAGNGLSDIKITADGKGYDLSPLFNTDVTVYILRIPENIERFTVNATAADPNSEIIKGNGECVIAELEGGLLEIVVQAQSGETKTYQLALIRSASDAQGLKTLTVNGVEVEIQNGKFEYEITVDAKTDKLELDYSTLKGEVVEVLGNTDLKPGTNTVVLKVLLTDGSYTFYTVSVVKKETSVWLYVAIVLAVLAAALAVLIVFLIVKRKKNSENSGKPDGTEPEKIEEPEKEETAASAEPIVSEPKEEKVFEDRLKEASETVSKRYHTIKDAILQYVAVTNYVTRSGENFKFKNNAVCTADVEGNSVKLDFTDSESGIVTTVVVTDESSLKLAVNKIDREMSRFGAQKKEEFAEKTVAIASDTVAPTETSASSEAQASSEAPEGVVTLVKTETLEVSYKMLTREQRSFYDNLKKYALSKEGTVLSAAKYYENIKIGKKSILKLQIKRNVTVASFALEDERLKQFRKQAAKTEGSQIKTKPTEIPLYDLAAYNTAVGMVDLMFETIVKKPTDS